MKKLTRKDKQILAGMAVAAVVVLLVRRSRAAATGDVIIGPVTVVPKTYTKDDAKQTALTTLVNQAYQILGLDLDTMQPTRVPSAADVLVVQSIIVQLHEGGRDSEANFLALALTQARSGNVETPGDDA